MPNVIAVIVLYQMELSDSASFTSLMAALDSVPSARGEVELLVADNSAVRGKAPVNFAGNYIFDGTNPGLARRYNETLTYAKERGAAWVLLLDQDTVLTHEYLTEVLELTRAFGGQRQVATILPKLEMDGFLLSPYTPLFQSRGERFSRDYHGMADGLLMAFNSGAVMSVDFLDSIGGFPEEYSLDYLDHATMHRLHLAGGKMYVMRCCLQHELSELKAGASTNLVRLAAKLRAERKYYKEFGSGLEYARSRLNLFRQVIGHARRGRFTEARIRARFLFL